MTQVIPPQTGFLFHDRLTHSLKVAQVAETLARRLIHKADPIPGGKVEDWIDSDHCYIAGLAHDIGHPPFGHAGEQRLQMLFDTLPDSWERQARGTGERTETFLRETRQGLEVLCKRSFEGNAQSTRIVGSLSVRQHKPLGLNLTLRSMAAIAKYPWLRGLHPTKVNKLAKKWSFYPEESSILADLEAEGFVKTVRVRGKVTRVHRWVEAEIMDWADDITYAVHDAEDFFRAGMLPLHRVRAGLRDLPADTDWMTSTFDEVRDDEIRSCFTYVAEKLSRTISFDGQPLAQHLPDMWTRLRSSTVFLPSGPFAGTHDSNAQVHRFASHLIRLLSSVTSTTLDTKTKRVQLQIQPRGVLVAEFFKALNDFFVIHTGALSAMQEGQSSSLEGVFHAYCTMTRGMLARMDKDDASRVRSVSLLRQVDLYREIPAALREHILANTQPDFINHLKSLGYGVTVNETAAKEFAIAVAVVDFLCGIRDSQLALLASQLNGSREPGSMPVNWLDS